MKEIHQKRMMVTPEQAKTWLARNIANNRTMVSRHVERIAEIIRSGHWVLNGNPIRFDTEGRLIDGQHRLSAVVLANMPIDTMVVWNLATEVIDLIDDPTTCKMRSVAHVAHMHGHKNATTKIAAARLVWAWQNGRLNQPTRCVLSAPETRDLLAQHPGLCLLVDEHLTAARTSGVVPQSVSIAMLYILSSIDADAARRFFDAVVDGANLQPGSPILALRNKCIAARAERRPLSAYDSFVAVVKAWNYWMTGQSVKQIVLACRDGGVRVPQIYGIELSHFFPDVKERYSPQSNDPIWRFQA
jgi:hypothetical protein